jgi:hypothetical protein
MNNQVSRLEAVSTNPSFLVEMSHPLRHIIMKRSYFLRSTRARTLFCLEQIAGKSWLEVSLAEKPKNDVLPWDQAHNLAARFKAELKADVFVEPAHEEGRHHKLTALDTASPLTDDAHAHEPHGRALGLDPRAGVFGGSLRMSGPGFGSQFGMSGFGMTGFGAGGVPGIADVPGMPSDDFLPAHVREALSFGEKSGEMILTALRLLPAFGKLPEATQNMFEVEATQLLQAMTATAQLGAAEQELGLVALLQHPGTSKHLSRFLAEALPAVA